MGVVYGDIGTSPLYAIKEVFGNAHHPVPITPDNVLGILSLVFWSLIVVVSFKYVFLILRADNKGEGGIMALMARVLADENVSGRTRRGVLLLGLFGAALFYGDGLITPAISVLSAVEGLEVATPLFAHYVIPVTIGILAGLFWIQRHGTARVGVSFGPITCVWFIALAALGVAKIVENPAVLAALWPGHALAFLAADPKLGFLSMGSVFLVVTGAEALYADMGHFGRRPIRLAWFGLVLPSLMLNYFGQGALLLADPEAIKNPFYLMAPDWFLLPLVGLATAATVIASQAVITGVYSITHQTIQLGYAPRMDLLHTSSSQMGQIYMPGVNWLMLAGVVGLVLAFKSSTNLAAAYGIAVTGTMIITTLFAYLVARHQWGWRRRLAVPAFGALLALDLVFLAANATKIVDGGWFPLVFGGFAYLLLTTWKAGRELVNRRIGVHALPLDEFVGVIESPDIVTVPGTAVFMTPYADRVPHALLHNLKHNKVLHERVVIASVSSPPVPRVADGERLAAECLSPRFYRVNIRYGFMEQPDVPAALERCTSCGLRFDPMATSYFLGRETVVPEEGGAMPYWREAIFATLYRNARTAADFFRLPPNQVVELGTRVTL
ncbi:MAG: potassium transporter Kup [Candidatus Nitricoxidivorans perseverans]|uniref:Probable potassium transport system protein Kup n=1 Tax=Candidatus Nitricoxidivorans perseverans TaxID=2975601 RepID=A0AA49IXW8_9PROT|nr:MAG: potassium transporter Kup [Candidatus Nitricoxidivorans perseverans]